MSGAKEVLVHLGGGMGDMLMATAMIEMLSRGGYAVDLCLQGDTRGVERLFDGWPFLRAVSPDPSRFEPNAYGYYIYGDDISGGPIPFVNRREAIKLHPVWDWHRGHELFSRVEMFVELARAIDPSLPVITQPSCATSNRTFDDISSKTCVLVPGGQQSIIIRKWPKFGALAERLSDVAVVGVPSDLDLSNRIVFPRTLRSLLGDRLEYQGRAWRMARPFADRFDEEITFPTHVKDYIGKLSIEDTAALIRQAGVVVGNDCGLTHLAVALGKPVIALLGPTSRRRVFPSIWTNVRVVARQYDCQPCQEKVRTLNVWRQSMGQCFCPYRLRCMNDITVEEVLRAVGETRNSAIVA